MDKKTAGNVMARYSSPEMLEIFSSQRRIELWRDLWIALAEAERALGLPIKKSQIEEMKKYRDKVNWDVASKKEQEIRHDVMAHVYAFGKQCKSAAPIIHLGATSAYVTDNADLIILREALSLIEGKLASVIERLSRLAGREKDTVTLAFTHFQPAQPTTVGKRACLWIQDFAMDLARLQFEKADLKFQGVKGATGTQDSFLKLFEGDKKKVLELDQRVTEKMGFERNFPVTGQTYPQKVDTKLVTLLACIEESAAKFATDLRLLQALHEIEEPRNEDQVGSSAMPYKQNPVHSERIVALARYGMNLVGNCYDTASNQWFERSLDDSANRRLTLAHAFQVCDGVLNLAINIASGAKVNRDVIAAHVEQELPFLQTEEVLMAAVREGGDRQILHEKIRKHSAEVVKNVREKGGKNDLLSRLRKDSAFEHIHPKIMVRADPAQFVGLAREQVDAFLEDVVEPIRNQYKSKALQKPKVLV